MVSLLFWNWPINVCLCLVFTVCFTAKFSPLQRLQFILHWCFCFHMGLPTVNFFLNKRQLGALKGKPSKGLPNARLPEIASSLSPFLALFLHLTWAWNCSHNFANILEFDLVHLHFLQLCIEMHYQIYGFESTIACIEMKHILIFLLCNTVVLCIGPSFNGVAAEVS